MVVTKAYGPSERILLWHTLGSNLFMGEGTDLTYIMPLFDLVRFRLWRNRLNEIFMELGEVVKMNHATTRYENVPANIRPLISWKTISYFTSIVTFRSVLITSL